ncbi:94_t:CDS:2 [Gigaspora margarita]|uniref:94_t:CDS:1 n=1 Tax=Gigaspora margarita TaxID=4874 RepID=A0ABN7VZY8_GIGMA|nr:94_t:CDS:2 [Gigaspora margarita]
MVQLSTSSTEDNPSIKDVTYSSFNMQPMRDSIVLSVRNFWQCIEVKSGDYKVKEETKNINSQRKKFLAFIEDSIQHSNEIRKYVSNLQLVIKCFTDQSVSDDNFRELESLSNDINRNLECAEMLMKQVKSIKDELVIIRNSLNEYKYSIQKNPSNIKSKTKDKLDKVEDKIKSSNTTIVAGSTVGVIGAVLTVASIVLAPFTACASIAIEAAVAGIVVGSAVAGGGTAVAVEGGISKLTKKAKSNDIKEKLEEEKKELIIIIESLESIVATIGLLIGYWNLQESIISDLLDKVNAARDNGGPNKLLIGATDKTLKDLESDELYAKDFCVTIRSLLEEDQTKFPVQF